MAGLKGKSGRKSLYQEKQAAEFLKKAFFEGVDVSVIDEIQRTIREKKGTIRLIDLLAVKAFNSERVLVEMFRLLVGEEEGSIMKENNTTIFYQVYLPRVDSQVIESESQVTVIDE